MHTTMACHEAYTVPASVDGGASRSAFCSSRGIFCGPRILLPNVPRWASGVMSVDASVHNTPFGSSGAGATVAETGGALAGELRETSETAAAEEDAKGAACTESTAARKTWARASFLRLKDMVYIVETMILPSRFETLFIRRISSNLAFSRQQIRFRCAAYHENVHGSIAAISSWH